MSEPLKSQFLHSFLDWAASQPDIRAAALVGSAARVDHPADEWSDYDLVVVAADPRVYFSSRDWLSAIGCVWASFIERTPAGEPNEVRVLFEGGIDVDFILVSLSGALQGFQNMPMVLEIMQRGTRALLDKEGLWATLPALPAPVEAMPPPTSQAFLEVVNDFWFHAAWTAKKLKRGEIWVARSCCDNYLKGLLLRMVEWEARAARGWVYNTWFNGRYLEEWALPNTVEELRQAFAHYDAQDIWRALQATMSIFRRISRGLAGQLAYPYPDGCDEGVSQWVTHIKS